MIGSEWIQISIVLIVGFLLRSIPSATWISRLFFKVDITTVGSKNPGMTNVLRTLGWKPAVPVIIIDSGKGFFASWLGFVLTQSITWALVAGLLAVLGHSFTIFASFKGGKGVLTGFGVFLFFTPLSALAGLFAWILVVIITRYVSLGSLVAATVMTLGIFLQLKWSGEPSLIPVFGLAFLVSGFVFYRHRSNIVRLINGNENKFQSAKTKKQSIPNPSLVRQNDQNQP